MAALGNASAPYGMKALRTMKGHNTTSRKPMHSNRLQKKKEEIYIYFLEKVDPIIGECITHLLLDQPNDIPNAMIDFFQKWAQKNQKGPFHESIVQSEQLPNLNKMKAKKEMKIFLATSISPIVSKLINRVAVKLPVDVIDFMITELRSMMHEDELLPDKPSTAAATTITENNKHAKATEVLIQNHKQHEPQQEAKASVSSTANISNVDVPITNTKKSLQIAVLGVGGSGKSTLVNLVQGKIDPKLRPTIGFRPLNFMADAMTEVKFYDLGGGKRIRDIWTQYYHDVHGILYVIDGSMHESANAEGFKEIVDVFRAALDSPFLTGKPLLVVVNKQDLPEAKSAEYWRTNLPIPEGYEQHRVSFIDCSVKVDDNVVDEQTGRNSITINPAVETQIETLLQQVLTDYSDLQIRVIRDSQVKAKEEMRKRIEREKRVLRGKIGTAFIDQLAPTVVTDLQLEADPANVFNLEEGENFLAAEVGEEQLNDVAREVAALSGYHRLALQIIGALKVPINKKKVAMSWEEIRDLLRELRNELGLPATQSS